MSKVVNIQGYIPFIRAVVKIISFFLKFYEL